MTLEEARRVFVENGPEFQHAAAALYRARRPAPAARSAHDDDDALFIHAVEDTQAGTPIAPERQARARAAYDRELAAARSARDYSMTTINAAYDRALARALEAYDRAIKDEGQ